MKNIGIGTIKYPQGKNLSETRGKLIGIGEVIYDGKRYFVRSKGTGVTPGPEPGMKKNTFRFKLNAPPSNFREVDSFGNMWKVVDADEHIYDVTLKLDENKKGEGLIYWGYNGPNYTATLIDVGDISEIKGFSYIAGAVFPANYCQLNFDVVPDYSNIEDFGMMFEGLKNTEFPAMDISNGKYFEGMFGATHITEAPEFIALPSDPRSFRGMFQYCEDMTTAPTELLNFPHGPDTVSYNDMFWNTPKIQNQINYVYGGTDWWRNNWTWKDGVYSLENSVVIKGQMALTQRSNLAIKNNGGDLMQFHDYEFTNDFNPMRCNDHEGGQFTWALQQREDTDLKVIIVSRNYDDHRAINLSGDWTENITEIEYDNSYSTFYDTLYFGKSLISAENIEQIYESIKDLLNFEVIDVSVSPFRDCPNVVDAAIPTEWGGKGSGIAPNTLRFAFSDESADPNTLYVDYGTWNRVENHPDYNNVWDWTYDNSDWSNTFMNKLETWFDPDVKIIAGNTSNVTDMRQMFSGCNALTSVSLFDTSNVTNMAYMFADCYSLTTVPLFDTSRVVDMEYMFNNCSSLTAVPLYDTSNVTSMYGTFQNCSSLQSAPLFDTSNVRDMDGMFYGCGSLTNVPLFNTSNVVTMAYMFYDCANIESGMLDLYQQASSGGNVTNYYDCFTNAGVNTGSGMTEREQIPADWGGDMY